MIEAQAHVVWEQSDGTHLDVTPNEDNETECVFVPDDSMTETPGIDYVPTEREKLTEDEAVDRFIECARAVDDHNDRAFTSSLVLPDPPELIELISLQSIIARLAQEMGG